MKNKSNKSIQHIHLQPFSSVQCVDQEDLYLIFFPTPDHLLLPHHVHFHLTIYLSAQVLLLAKQIKIYYSIFLKNKGNKIAEHILNIFLIKTFVPLVFIDNVGIQCM